MTVTSCLKEANGNEHVTCKWKDAEGILSMSDFPVETLDLVETFNNLT